MIFLMIAHIRSLLMLVAYINYFFGLEFIFIIKQLLLINLLFNITL